uniref:Uncharacterized protein n=1 Tax=Arundo donax TaxID=35708 RepID=A0A0A9CYH9_ARUDO
MFQFPSTRSPPSSTSGSQCGIAVSIGFGTLIYGGSRCSFLFDQHGEESSPPVVTRQRLPLQSALLAAVAAASAPTAAARAGQAMGGLHGERFILLPHIVMPSLRMLGIIRGASSQH